MSIIGDLERLFATSLYPLRVPIAIGLVAVLVALLVVARRRRWDAAARRHPRRTAAVTLTALVVGAPIAWYLASPLFIRTELVEPAPVAQSAPSDAPPPGPSTEPSVAQTLPPAATPTPTPAPTAAPTPTPTPFAPSTVAAGEFHGADEFHFGQGSASVIEIEPGRFHLRFDDFSVRNGPDLYVYLSSSADGYADDALEVGRLKATDGAFGYDLPADVDPADFRSALIWCKQFAVLFAVAPLSPS